MVGNPFAISRRCMVAIAALSLAGAAVAGAPAIAEKPHQPTPRLDVSFEATPLPAVRLMLEMAKVGHDDFVVDLGCGDGRIPITAAKEYGARGLGVDLDPQRIREARTNAERSGVVGKVDFVEGNLFDADISKATVVTLFLWPDINLKLRPRLLALAPGTRIVSHDHDMGDWRPDSKRTSKTDAWRDLYLWIVPARIDGAWQLSVDGRAIDLKIQQKYQRFDGTTVDAGRTQRIRNGQIKGDQVTFDLAIAPGKSRRFTGHVSPTGEMAGEGWWAKRKG